MDTSLLQNSDTPLSNAFAAAYIRPKLLPPEVDVTQATFNRNVECPPVSGLTVCDARPEVIPTLVEGRDSAPLTSPSYWVTYIQGAFQPGEKEDSDPNSEGLGSTLGITAGLTSRFGSQVYTEVIGDTLFKEERERCRQVTPAHELGHQFGRQHVDGHGIMGDVCRLSTGRYFAAESLRTLRENGVRP